MTYELELNLIAEAYDALVIPLGAESDAYFCEVFCSADDELGPDGEVLSATNVPFPLADAWAAAYAWAAAFEGAGYRDRCELATAAVARSLVCLAYPAPLASDYGFVPAEPVASLRSE